jgi:hypothetical protein
MTYKRKDDTFDTLNGGGISTIEPTNSSSQMLQELRNSLGSDFNPMSPKVVRHYDKIQTYFKTVKEGANDFDGIPIVDKPVHPKKIEKWIATALRESIMKGYMMKDGIEPNK